MSESRFVPEELYERGYTDLVSVIPPGAQLVPSSTIPQSQVGKIPGRRATNGLWAGYNWRKHEPTVDDVRKWAVDGANIGTRADRFPGVDIDCTDPAVAQVVEDVALATLGPAPVRVGRAPKRLLMYRTDEPFSRMRLWVKLGSGEQHLVEVLGAGQQYLIAGTHPVTQRPYEWNQSIPDAADLTPITRDQVEHFLTELTDVLGILGYGVEREGDGRRGERVAGDQHGLLAPSIDVLRDAVRMIPNTDDFFPQRDDYIKMAVAIRAAAGEENEPEGFSVFAEWAARHEADGRVAGNPETWRSDWRRLRGPFAVGWGWIAEMARQFGFNDAALEFDTVESPSENNVIEAPAYSDQWLARRVADKLKGVLRFVPETGKYLVWHSGSWHQDADLLAEAMIADELRHLADKLARTGATAKDKKDNLKVAERVCSARTANAVEQFLRADRAIAVSVSALDHDPWVLNTPTGLVDLKTGELKPSDPDALCTKVTSVPPDFGGAAPEWKRFLAEATGGDVALEAYLQRLCGYALTGSTREQHLSFIYGEGGNGKGTFLNTVADILGDYARTADMNTFTASRTDKHSTDLAMLAGARLVTASETEEGKRWDEAKVKQLTGGDKVTARFMRQDNFTYLPQFKLVFIGNHRPEIRTVDRAMRRRIQMVPFIIVPARVDPDLAAKLREEGPAILAWMIEGCLAWQRDGLNPPRRVQEATAAYFRDEDAVGRWLSEATEADEASTVTVHDLYVSYRQWAQENGEYVMSLKRLSTALAGRKLEKWQHPSTRRAGFKGIRILERAELGIL